MIVFKEKGINATKFLVLPFIHVINASKNHTKRIKCKYLNDVTCVLVEDALIVKLTIFLDNAERKIIFSRFIV